jgi:hypothetical protein
MEKERLSTKILKLKQAIHELGENYLLLYIQLGFVEKMELDCERGDTTLSDYLEDMHTLVDICLLNYEDYDCFMRLKDMYSEALMYSKLRSVLRIGKVPRKKGDKTPDFRVVHHGEEIFVELKSLNMADGSMKHKGIMESALERKIELANQVVELKKNKKGPGNIVASNVGVIQPYYSPNKPYDSSSPKLVIETLIGKIKQNIKQEQFSCGDTILLVDFAEQLPLLETPEESLLEEYIGEYRDNSELYDFLLEQTFTLEEHNRYLNSLDAVQKQRIYSFKAKGGLWHVAYGEVGTILVEDSNDEKPEILEKEGILKEFGFIKGLLFHIDGRFYATMPTVDPLSVCNLFTYLESIRAVQNKSFVSAPFAKPQEEVDDRKLGE